MLSLGRDVAPRKNPPVARLIPTDADDNAPADYWSAVRDARRWSIALSSALPTGSPDAERADLSGLIAQASAWAGVSNEWTPAWRGLAFATSARGLAESMLGDIELDVKPVTLAGTAGQVPVTITSGASQSLNLRLVQEAGRAVRLGSDDEQLIVISPGENFIEVPVELVNVLSGHLRVAVMAADVELSHDTVEIRASYLDRLALAGGVFVLLSGLLAFIITRVRAAQAASNGAPRPDER
jgi:hypothetical protein